MPTTLIEPAALAARLAAPDWAIVDCRFDLARPEWGALAWAAGHIPSARYAHLDRDLSGPRTGLTGRHPLPAIATLTATFGRWGIDKEVQVVAYDQGAGAFAARLWWLLRWLGHQQVAVLNGGLAAWERAGLPLDTAATVRAPRRVTAAPAAGLVVTTAALAQAVAAGALTRGELTLVDARSADRFAGENETLDPVAGHIDRKSVV
jgi:thiosulfate/3-mercaptopyruvate sulfurtransferase